MTSKIGASPNVLVIVLGVVAIILAGGLLRAFVFEKLWAWFVVPQFSVPPISLITALGLSMLVSLFTDMTSAAKSAENKELPELFGMLGGFTMAYLFTLLFGWVLHVYF